MRIRQVVLPLAAAAALAGSLTACSGPGDRPPADAVISTAPSSSAVGAAAALELVGTRWAVSGHPGTTVRFDGLAVTAAVGDRSSSWAWSAQGDQVLIGAPVAGLDGPVDAPWLTATSVREDGSGWTLLGPDGGTTARLTPDGSAPATTSTRLLAAAVPGRGVVDAPASALEGRWTVAGDPRTAIAFTGGTWSATASCTTAAIGGRGRYRVLPGGRLLVVRTMTPIRGCPVVDGAAVGRGSAITSIARAGSFRVRGGTLTLFDRDGAELGSLTRG